MSSSALAVGRSYSDLIMNNVIVDDHRSGYDLPDF